MVTSVPQLTVSTCSNAVSSVFSMQPSVTVGPSFNRIGARFVVDELLLVVAVPEGDHGPQPRAFSARTCTR